MVVLDRLQHQGLKLWAEGEDLHVKGQLTDALRETIRAHKPELLEYLRWTQDPRPDLGEDSLLWQRLLPLAYEWDGQKAHGLFGVLHGLRCSGARLEATGSSYRLAPRYEAEGGVWRDPEEWLLHREEWLVPYREAILNLFRHLKRSQACRLCDSPGKHLGEGWGWCDAHYPIYLQSLDY